MRIRSHANAEIVFEHFAGECFNNDDLILARSESLSDEEFNELYNIGIEAINKVSKK